MEIYCISVYVKYDVQLKQYIYVFENIGCNLKFEIRVGF